MNQINISTLSLTSKPLKKNGRISWPGAPSMTQGFSLPDSIIYYVTKNPSTPEGYSKMIQSCKYFFEKNPIIVAARILDNGKLLCSKVDFECTFSRKCCFKFDIIKMKSKIWLTNKFKSSLIDVSDDFYERLASKLYRCEDAKLLLYNTTISMKAFQIYASKFQKFDFCGGVKILDNDGNMVMLENILESIPNIREFWYDFGGVSSATTSTMKNILKLQNLDNLHKIVLFDVPESFNVKDLTDFIKNHENIKFWLQFEWNISVDYKNQLNHLIDTIIASEIPKCVIRYAQQDYENVKIMYDRYTR